VKPGARTPSVLPVAPRLGGALPALLAAGFTALSIAVFVAGLAAPAAAADDLVLAGRPVQGGLMQGRTVPGARVRVDGRHVRVSTEGLFLVGFGRDAPPRTEVHVRLPDGTEIQRTLEVARRAYDIQRIDGLAPRKVTPSEEDLARIRAEAALVREARRRDDPRTDFLTGFEWPVVGRITGVYGSQRILNGEPRRPHFGIDIAAPAGTPVRAPADGVVTLVREDMFFSGGTLILDHGHGLSSAFLHLREVLVPEGTRVRRGDVIAEVGASGRATGAHLDWRMNLFDRRLDPAPLAGAME